MTETKRDRSDRHSRGNSSDVLKCDTCQRPIESVDEGMLYWTASEPGRYVGELLVCHNPDCEPVGDLNSLGLYRFALRESARRWLTALKRDFKWDGRQVERLDAIADAAASLRRRSATRFRRGINGG